MPDNKTKITGSSEKTPLLSSSRTSDADIKLRIKVLRGDRERSTSEDDTLDYPHENPSHDSLHEPPHDLPHDPPHDSPPIGNNPAQATDSEAGNEAGNKGLLAAAGYGLLISVLIVAGIHFFRAYRSPANDVEVDDFNTVSKQTSKRTFKPPRSTINRSIDIVDIVSNLKKDTVWDIHKIHFLKLNWIQLDTEKQWEISREEWFQEFLTALDQQLNSPISNSLFNKEQILARGSALIELQELLTNLPPQRTLSETAQHTDAPNVTIVSSDILDDTHNGEIPDTTVTKTIRELPGTQVAIVDDPLNTSEPQTPLRADTKTEKESPENTLPTNITETLVSTPMEVRTDSDVAVEEHKNAGRIDSEIPLAKTAQEDVKLTAEKFKTEESTQISPSAQNAARDPLPTDKPIQNAPPKVAAVKKTKEVKKYYYVNGSIESLLNNKPQGKLTVAEINDLIVQLSNNYERGDFKGFASLFTDDPTHENYDALKQTKKRFEDWLSGTSDRQMFIKELNWAFNNNIAIGKGVLSLTLISNDHPRIVTIKKSIELSVKKDDQKVYITKFEQADF